MFESLTERLGTALDALTRRGALSKSDVDAALREVRVALLEADVALSVVKDFVAQVRGKAVGEAVLKSVTPGQMVIKIVSDHLIELLGSAAQEIDLAAVPPAAVMVVGLQGSGKTTSAAKIAMSLQAQEKKKVLMASLDVYRPAAQEQLRVLGEQAGVKTLSVIEGQMPVDIARRAMDAGRLGGFDVVTLDTAGRLHIDENLMNELKDIKEIADPNEIMLVVDAMTGQDAVNVAESFNDLLDITGVTLTKLDGDTRGGAALSIRSVTEKPIKFVGMSEKMDGLEAFHPDRMAQRILGMGDVLSIIEKAQANVDETDQKELEKKIKDQSFTLDDFLAQMDQVKDLGPLDELLKMMPGANKIKGLDKMQMSGKEIDHVQAIIRSMTMQERENPSVINASRKKRIARGSGRSLQEVNRLLKQFNEMKKMMKQMTSQKGKKKNPFGNMGLPF